MRTLPSSFLQLSRGAHEGVNGYGLNRIYTLGMAANLKMCLYSIVRLLLQVSVAMALNDDEMAEQALQGIGYFIFSSDIKLRSLRVIIVVVGSCTIKMLNSQDRVSHEGYVHRFMLEVLFESETGRKESECLSV
jgi:hypothetical protein